MKSIRLLPVVIFAALALLLFKGIGLVTNGGYVLTGPTAVVAQEASPDDNNVSLPSEATATDTSPTLGDTAPTLPAAPDAASHVSSSGEAASSAASGASSASAPASAETRGSASASSEAAANACDTSSSAAPPSPGAGGELNDKIGNALAKGCPPPDIPVNANGDALPTIKDGNGHIVPLQVVDGDNSEPALLQRLSDRRAELDKRSTELDMRTALVEAAEKRLDDKTKALEALQAQVNALVDEKQATEDAGFKSVVSMYETMKAKDAARIFDTLDLQVLLKVARAMNPRQMSPILAAMSAQPAQQLTTAMAATVNTNVVPDPSENLAALPQIVGK